MLQLYCHPEVPVYHCHRANDSQRTLAHWMLYDCQQEQLAESAGTAAHVWKKIHRTGTRDSVNPPMWWVSAEISRSDSSRASFHYWTSSLPDTHNPITLNRSAAAWARTRQFNIWTSKHPGQTRAVADSQINKEGSLQSKPPTPRNRFAF